MTLPSVEAARGWSGLAAVDRDDQPIGRITGVYLDHDTGMPEWALVATPQRRRAFVPLAGAARRGDRVAVSVPRAAVGGAPAVRPGRELSDRDAARLYGHYVGAAGGPKGGARRAPGRGRLARLGWRVLAGVGAGLVVVVAAGRVRRRRAAGVGGALARALGGLAAGLRGAPRGRRRRRLGPLGGPRHRGGRRS
jgi:PRC-barrel domain